MAPKPNWSDSHSRPPVPPTDQANRDQRDPGTKVPGRAQEARHPADCCSTGTCDELPQWRGLPLDPLAVGGSTSLRSHSEHLTRTVLRGHPNLRHAVRDTRSLQLRGVHVHEHPYIHKDHHAPSHPPITPPHGSLAFAPFSSLAAVGAPRVASTSHAHHLLPPLASSPPLCSSRPATSHLFIWRLSLP
jgi:hypothetical protein